MGGVFAAHHGGTLLMVAPDALENGHLFARHAFVDEPGRRRFRSLCLSTLETLAKQCAESGRSPIELYRASAEPRIALSWLSKRAV